MNSTLGSSGSMAMPSATNMGTRFLLRRISAAMAQLETRTT